MTDEHKPISSDLGIGHRGDDDISSAVGALIDFTTGTREAVAATSFQRFFDMFFRAMFTNDSFHVSVTPGRISFLWQSAADNVNVAGGCPELLVGSARKQVTPTRRRSREKVNYFSVKNGPVIKTIWLSG